MAFPKIDTCIVCEAVRQELNNKQIILGYFGITPYASISIGNFQLPVTICFIFAGGGGPPGKFDVDLRLTDSSGKVVSTPINATSIKEGELGLRSLTNVFMGFNGLLTGPGVYRVSLIVDGREHYTSTVGFDHPPVQQ